MKKSESFIQSFVRTEVELNLYAGHAIMGDDSGGHGFTERATQQGNHYYSPALNNRYYTFAQDRLNIRGTGNPADVTVVWGTSKVIFQQET